MSGFRELIVWKRADELAFRVYGITKGFPKDELYGMVSQMRRAAVSVAANIAEGAGRRNRNETKQFLNISLGFLAELDCLLGLARRLGFLTEEEFFPLDQLRKEVGILSSRLYGSLCSRV